MIRALVIAAVALAGCNDPAFTLRFRVTDGLADACRPDGNTQVFECEKVPMSCAAVANVRVFNPNTPTSPIINVCQELMMAPTPTLCEVAQVNLPTPPMPVDAQTLQVEILVYPKNRLDIDMATNTPICPAMVDFGADGFPAPSLVPCMPDEPCEPTPAIGGTAFYHPGDSETVVELGCADLKQMNDTEVCVGASTNVTATVTDFDTLVSVSPTLAQQLTVGAGQPMTMLGQGSGDPPHSTLEAGDLAPLRYTPVGITPSWSGSLAGDLKYRCVQVDEPNVAARTDSVRCIRTTDPMSNQLVGTRLQKMSLDMMLLTLGYTSVPDPGLTIGIVLDDHGNPAAGIQVTATDDKGDPSLGGTIEYLSAMRDAVGGTVTSASGIFVSRNLTFGTVFNAMQGAKVVSAVGGLIDGKVTIVVLQLPSPTST